MENKSLTSSVLMATYNGMRFLIPQLESIRNQTVPADEVVICDDGSSDGTVDAVRGYIEKYNLANWHLNVNEKNKGWKKNFMDMAVNCRTDLIFFADQDDVWSVRKIEQMKSAVVSNPKIDLLYSDYRLTKHISEQEEKGEWRVNKNPVTKINDDVYKYTMVRMGCAYCMRKSFVEEVKDFYWEGYQHDAFFYRTALVKGTLYNLNSVLIYHRLHGDNAS